MTAGETRYMRRALALARRGEGRVEPNPMVGCVLVKGGRIVGEGYHRVFGGPHAERAALAAAGPRARGATVYVTLEPCCHFGKTPPCTDALIAAGVARVVAAVRDPNPLVAGKGLRKLRAAGIRVETGMLDDDAAALLAPFIAVHARRRPYVILKWAQSIDGRIATRTGDSKWITSLESRRAAHALRARVDAVVVGVNTVLADDPDLTARLVRPRRIATRVILDARLRTPATARVVQTADCVPTLIATTSQGWARAGIRRRLESAGCEIIRLPGGREGVALPALLRALHVRRMTNVLVEGGGRVLGGFLDEALADEAVVFVAPRLIGGEAAPGPLRGVGPRTMNKLPPLERVSARRIGPDLCYNLVLRRPNPRT
ncbi:MAG: bifunctional diaminohydroxyphosphoribosylaminopyrimidine deaminase/5-amino-6-(5-phosphoribosylamino)uracil reductase RibD [Planctomycetota bacterium]|nr:MAG: bifunctional diaminohydroxyphosphoribosylaminopyrimidine deaminase/5-amino-6-(5-phosphoribosylamino)uracil reductase RibD [Planctomycetota bacterium]